MLDPKLGVDVDVNGPGLCAAATPQPDPSAPAATSAEVTNFMEVFPAFMPERHRIEGHDAAFFNLAAPGMPRLFPNCGVQIYGTFYKGCR